MSRMTILAFILFSAGIAAAAIPAAPTDALLAPAKILVGGETKQTLSLLGVDYVAKGAKKNGERVKLTWGNAVMEPWKGAPGFFHIEYREAQREAVVELARTVTSFADLKKIQASLGASAYLKSMNVDYDRTSQNLLIHMTFKAPVALSAATGKDKVAGTYLAVDFRGTTPDPAPAAPAASAVGRAPAGKGVVKAQPRRVN